MNPILWLLHFVTRFLTVREIRGEDRTLYLSRYRVFGWMPGDKRKYPICIYLHYFHRGDLDDALHSHPWAGSTSFILAGGYTEERINVPDEADPNCVSPEDLRVRRVRPFALNVFRRGDYHRIVELHGREAWSLFVTGPKTGSWGFWVFGRGHVEWRERLAERGIPVPAATHEEV
jgi:hypothetical protein